MRAASSCRWSWRPELGRLRALLLLALVGLCLRAHGAADVAALGIVRDGRATDAVGLFVLRGGEAHASAATWSECGVRLSPATIAAAGERLVSAAELPGVTAHVDAATQTLHLSQSVDPAQLTVLDASRGLVPAQASAYGAVLNYDAFAQTSAGRSVSSALLEARGFSPWLSLDHAAVVSSIPGSGHVRLDTTLEHVDSTHALRLRAGDVLGGALHWSRPVRLGGVQARTDFTMRPDLLTGPSPLIAGTASLPSTVDVLVNGVRQFSQPVEPGRFEVRQLPMVSGRGDVAVVVRDALGRESVQTLPFYAAPRQLAKGIQEYSVEAGRVRRRFGSESNDYGESAALASWRRGLRDDLTLEAHGEASKATRLLGGGAIHALPGIGSVSLDAAASHGDAGSGHQAGIGAERLTPSGHLGVAVARASRGYRDVAATQGAAVPLRSLRVSGSTTLGRWGSVGAAFVSQRLIDPLPVTDSAPRRQRLATGSYAIGLGRQVHAQVSAFRDFSGANRGVALMLSMPIGARASASAAVQHDHQGGRLGVQAAETDLEPGDWGWRLQHERADKGDAPDRSLGELNLRLPVARLSAGVEAIDGRSAARVGAQGALVALDGSLHASLPVRDSLAVVEVPDTPGVTVYHENRPVGRTDARGRVVVPNLLPFQPNRIGIDPLDLPMGTEIGDVQRELRPADRGGVRLRFAVERSRSVLVALTTADGAPLPLGAVVRVAGQDGAHAVGHGGQAYLRDLQQDGDNRLEARWAGGRCSAEFRVDLAAAERGRMIPLTCR